MTESTTPSSEDQQSDQFFETFIHSQSVEQPEFTVAFRGYDKDEVNTAIGDLSGRLQRATTALDEALLRHREEVERARSENSTTSTELEEELAIAQARAADAENQVQTLTAEMLERPDDDEGDESEGQSRPQFEAVLRVAEEQATAIIQNATIQAERLLSAARDQEKSRRASLDADVARITAQAEQDADQVRLKMDTEYTAHEARIEREQAHVDEKVTQAEREAATIRTEAEKGAASLRALVTRETAEQRTEAEREVTEMNARVLEFEETLTRRQDDAQQEFLVLHNQAVAHAERITSDANEQVASSLEHAQRISARADDYEKLMRAQASQIEADAQIHARESLDRAQIKAKKIVDTVIEHSTSVLRDAEDRTRELRWQQQQLTSFMAEVRELIRPENGPSAESLHVINSPVSAADDDEDVDDAEDSREFVSEFVAEAPPAAPVDPEDEDAVED
ncbi:cell division initiation protein [Paramicrobacterium chengjingii]|uniref:Cell division initiation protein n=1 Tax=Paramicrobacterium chengjingii TaxID=2769067 RepID=A0ABX6YFA3_9MICO|nr:cell division initiation protein [Microbacterium chengjingii]QPZ37082.1 cell division initiation protein [Microbacterium chengjingii]